jgi:S1-C subfamily serine protease
MEDISRRHGLREGFGVLIVEVMADTPAARAGLKNGDLVVAFNGRPVVDTRMLQRLIASASLGDEAKVTVLRPETGRRALTVQLAAMPPDVAGDRVAAEFGFLTREPVPEGEPARRLVGLVVPSVSVVARGSSAEEAGLRVGDVILSVNEAAVISREALRVALAEVPLDRPLRLSVRREGAVLSLSLAPSERR